LKLATWNRIFEEIQQVIGQDQQRPPAPGQPGKLDVYRRGKIAAVEAVSKRPLVVYVTSCTTPGKPVGSEMLMLDISDKLGFKTVTDNIDGPNLDVWVHSPGGYPDATESIVQQLRGKYSNIRFIVPAYAKSAATMLVMSGNEILMDRDAELGPIDPQMRTQNGNSPAEAILEQFKKAQAELQGNPTMLPSWIPILTPLGPSLLVDAQHAIELSKTLVKTWLLNYMFAGDVDAEEEATRVATYLGDHAKFLSHGRAVKIPDLLGLGVKVSDIRANRNLQEVVDDLYCCLDIVLASTPAAKIFENSRGDALVRNSGMIQQILRMAPQPMPMPAPMPPPMPRRH
jgi:hypothetical protein